MVLKFFIQFIIGDTAGHNDLCLQYQTNAEQPCRTCHCIRDKLSAFDSSHKGSNQRFPDNWGGKKTWAGGLPGSRQNFVLMARAGDRPARHSTLSASASPHPKHRHNVVAAPMLRQLPHHGQFRPGACLPAAHAVGGTACAA